MEVAPSPPLRPRKPWVAALLTLWLPGLGQLYSGQWKRASAAWLAGPLLLFVLVIAGLPRTYVGFLVWSGVGVLLLVGILWDASRLARRTSDYRLRPFNRWYLYLVLGFASPYVLHFLVPLLPLRTFQIPSVSMEPTLRRGDHLVADLRAWRNRTPARGDLVIYVAPDQPDVAVLKRVLAVSGETIEIRHKVVLIDGQPLAHDWGRHVGGAEAVAAGGEDLGERDFGPVKMPPGTFYAVGDNRNNSWDSRFYGPVRNESLRGQPLYVYWAKDRSRIGERIQ